MALFTDSDIVTAAMLNQIDGEVSGAAATSRPLITLEGPGSICEQAWRECATRILSVSQLYASARAEFGASAGSVAAVLNTGSSGRTAARMRLEQVVATEMQYAGSQSAVELWVTYAALAIFFRDASSRMVKGGDRYADKHTQYKRDATFWWMQLRNNGLPVVSSPLMAPGAKHSVGAGSWSTANVSAVAQAGALGGTYRVALSWIDQSRGYVSHINSANAESAPSVPVSIIVAAGNALAIDITSLNPPAGVLPSVGTSQGVWSPLRASAWNLWVGTNTGPLILQRELIPIATKTLTLAGDPFTGGMTAGSGQFADGNQMFLNVVGRA